MSSGPLPESLGSLQLSAVHQLLDRVADRQRQDFGNIVSDFKPDGSLITACDRWSDQTIVSGIAQIAREEGVLSEEGSQFVPESSAYWISYHTNRVLRSVTLLKVVRFFYWHC